MSSTTGTFNTQKAVIATEAGDLETIKVGDVPATEGPIPADSVRIAVEHVAINPVDYKMVAYNFFLTRLPAQVLGEDLAGTVVEVGGDVTAFSVGDKVTAFNPIDVGIGAFREVAELPWWCVFHQAEGVELARGVALPLVFNTAVTAMFYDAPLAGVTENVPEKSTITGAVPILIWGGSSSVGQVAIQIAKFMGYRVLTTASASNHARLLELGADECFDYHDEDVESQVRDALHGLPLRYAFDTVSAASTITCANLVTADPEKPGVVSSIVQGHDEAAVPEGVVVVGTLVAYMSNKALGSWVEENHPTIEALLNAVPVRPNSTTQLGGSWEDVVRGIKELHAGVSATKLVASLGQE